MIQMKNELINKQDVLMLISKALHENTIDTTKEGTRIDWGNVILNLALWVYGIPNVCDLVRCKDCIHYQPDPDEGIDAGMVCELTNMAQPAEGFCNWGTTDENIS